MRTHRSNGGAAHAGLGGVLTSPRLSRIAVVAAAALLIAWPLPGRAQGTPRVVEITAKRFEFNPKEIRLHQGEPVTIRLTTEDVTHGFFMKALGIDTVVEPGKPTEITITPRKTGTFTTICDHFCGEGHGNMHMTIVVE